MFPKSKELTEFVAYTIFFYLIPVLLLLSGFFPWGSNNIVLVFSGVILMAYAIAKPISPKDLGLRKDNLAEALVLSLLVTGFGLLVLSFLWGTGVLRSEYGQNPVLFYVFYIAVSAPLQEYVFRSLMFYELGLFFKDRHVFIQILISSLIYSFSHVFYRDMMILLVTFIIGIFWGFLYYKKPNFWAVALSHMILGAATVALGII